MFEIIFIAASLAGVLLIQFCDLLRRKGKAKEDFLFRFRILGICVLWMGYLLTTVFSKKTLPYSLIPLGVVLSSCGFFILVDSLKTLKKTAFLGPNGLIMEGLFRITRHPLYLGVLLFFLGGLFLSRAFLAAICVGIWVFHLLKSAGEEEDELYRKFGEPYLKYKQSVPMLIPMPRRKLN